MSVSYESAFGLAERPFSLTPDPRFFYKSRSHGRALETLTFALRRRERIIVVTGDLGVGKTVLCRTLLAQVQRRSRACYVASPLMETVGLWRLLLKELNPSAAETWLGDVSAGRLHALLGDALESTAHGAVVVIDEAHLMPRALADDILALASMALSDDKALQVVLVGQAPAGEVHRLGFRDIDGIALTRVRLLPLGREESAEYVMHRLACAGADGVRFSARALDFVFVLSGGVPRLINLLCERALQETAALGVHVVEPAAIDHAAASLELPRVRPRRFRWYTRRAS